MHNPKLQMKQNEAMFNCARSVIFQTKHLYTLQLLQVFRYAAARPTFFGEARLNDFKKNTLSLLISFGSPATGMKMKNIK